MLIPYFDSSLLYEIFYFTFTLCTNNQYVKGMNIFTPVHGNVRNESDLLA